MDLNTINNSLTMTIASPSTQRAFKQMRARDIRLRQFERPEDLLRFLRRRDAKRAAARSRVTAALIAAAQDNDDSVALSILLKAFLPGLLRVCGHLQSRSVLTKDEIDALLLESFFNRVHSFDLTKLGHYAALNLIRGTQKSAWRRLRKEQRYHKGKHQLSRGFRQVTEEAPLSPEEQLIELQTPPLDAPGRFKELVKDESKADILIMLETYGAGCPLSDWLRRHQSEQDAVMFRREYERLRRRRSRAVERIKTRTERVLRPIQNPSSLYLSVAPN